MRLIGSAHWLLSLSPFWKAADDQTRYVNNFFVVLSSFLLMLFGLALIGG